MNGQLRSELLKIATTRTVALILLLAAALTLLGTLIEGLSPTLGKLAQPDQQRTLLGAGIAAVLFATLAGVVVVTGEFRYGTIRPTLLFEPRRRVVLAAKLVAAALAGVVFAVVCVGVSVGAGLAILAARRTDLALTSGELLALVFGTIATTMLGGMLGVAVGALVRNQVGAIIAVVAYAFLVDAVLFAAVPSLGRYLPGKAGDALAGQSAEHLLTPGLGAAVLVAWTIAFVATATLRNDRSDV